MKILVTGSSGFIGRHLVTYLTSGGHEVFGVDLQNGYHILYPEQIEFQAEAVVHLAAMASVGDCQNDPAKCIETNVLGTARMIEYAKSCGAKRFIFASSGAVYGECAEAATITTPRNPLSWYGMSKVLAEKLLEREDALEVTTLRIGNVVGGDAHQGRIVPTLMRCAERGEVFHARGFDSVRMYVSIASVLSVISRSLMDPCLGTVNVGATLASIREVVDAVSLAMNREIKVIPEAGNPWEPKRTEFYRDVMSDPIQSLVNHYVGSERASVS